MASSKLYLDVFTQSKCGKQLQCVLCNCWLPSGAEKFMNSHINGRKHIQQLQKKLEKDKTFMCSVYVKGFTPTLPNLEDELVLYFENMGAKVKDIYVDKNTASYAIIEFLDKEHVDNVICCDDKLFHGKKLIIRRREISKKNSKTKAVEDGESYGSSHLPQELEDNLNVVGDVDSQMQMLMDFYKLSCEDKELRNLVANLLENVLVEVYVGCKVLLFGSSVNGVGEKGCDVDLTLLAENLKDDVCNEIREIIQRFAPGCKNVSVVHSSKTCAVIKFFHTQSNLNIDLSLNNHLAIRNTELLKIYISYDSRVPLILFSIRKWAKCFAFSGHSTYKITPYSLTLMVIYYLQQIDPPVLPCLQSCHQVCGDLVGIWNCAFCKTCKTASGVVNKLLASDLLFGFFKFYSLFDFNTTVIAIHCRSTLTRDLVYDSVNKFLLGDAERDFKFNSPLAVQDPFKLSHNVTHNLSLSGLTLLVDALKKVTSLYSEMDPEKISLTKLFMQVKNKVARKKQKHKRNRSNIYTISLPNCHHISSNSKVICSHYIKNILTQDLQMRIGEEKFIKSSEELSYTSESSRVLNSTTETPHVEPAESFRVLNPTTETPHVEPTESFRVLNSTTETPHVEPTESFRVLNPTTETPHVEPTESFRILNSTTETLHVEPTESFRILNSTTETPHVEPTESFRVLHSTTETPHVEPDSLKKYCIERESHIRSFTATAYTDTWTNRRKQKRLNKRLKLSDGVIPEKCSESIADDDSSLKVSETYMPTLEISSTPNNHGKKELLHFNVTISQAQNDNDVCRLKLEPFDDLQNLEDFQTFYAFIKKQLITVFK